jgi:hypothetical protein
MASYGMLRRVALVRTGVSEKLSASFIRVTRIGELGTTLAVTSNRRTLRRNTKSSEFTVIPKYLNVHICKRFVRCLHIKILPCILVTRQQTEAVPS